jgi:hypothetical protein
LGREARAQGIDWNQGYIIQNLPTIFELTRPMVQAIIGLFTFIAVALDDGMEGAWKLVELRFMQATALACMNV